MTRKTRNTNIFYTLLFFFILSLIVSRLFSTHSAETPTEKQSSNAISDEFTNSPIATYMTNHNILKISYLENKLSINLENNTIICNNGSNLRLNFILSKNDKNELFYNGTDPSDFYEKDYLIRRISDLTSECYYENIGQKESFKRSWNIKKQLTETN